MRVEGERFFLGTEVEEQDKTAIRARIGAYCINNEQQNPNQSQFFFGSNRVEVISYDQLKDHPYIVGNGVDENFQFLEDEQLKPRLLADINKYGCMGQSEFIALGGRQPKYPNLIPLLLG